MQLRDFAEGGGDEHLPFRRMPRDQLRLAALGVPGQAVSDRLGNRGNPFELDRRRYGNRRLLRDGERRQQRENSGAREMSHCEPLSP